MNSNFIDFNGILVDKKIFTKKFSCDLEKCKGACCTMKSDYGAPLLKDEIEEIEKVYDIVKENLSERNVKEIEENGFWEEKENMLMTRSIGRRDCVFVYWDGDVAKCAIEKAYFEKKIKFRKPISCHLFPIRVTNFGGPILKYEEYSDCKPALKKGKKENINILNFCESSIKRGIGKSFFNKLIKYYEK